MPWSINGIGTHYYGKSNVYTHQGACEGCQYQGELSDYNCRLWFVIFFIPIFPLGRKRITDHCPSCSQHRAMSANQYEQFQQEAIQEGMKEFQEATDKAEAAVKLHGAYVYFGRTEEAGQMLDYIRENLTGNADAQLYVGSVLSEQGSPQAGEHFRRALELAPEKSEAKQALAYELIKQDNLDEARSLLGHLEEPDSGDEAMGLSPLAHAYNKAGRHQEALELLRFLHGRFPALSKNQEFQNLLRSSEKATGKKTEIPRPAPNRTNLLVAAVVVLLIAGAFVADYLMGQRQTLHIVNGHDQAITVSFPGQSPVQVSANRRGSIVLPAGPHTATLSGAMSGQESFEISLGIGDGLFGTTSHVYAPGGAGMVVWEKTVYSSNPCSDPREFKLHFDKRYMSFKDIDYLFLPFPSQIKVDRGSGKEWKARIDVAPGKGIDYLLYYIQDGDHDKGYEFSEWWLKHHPYDSTVLQTYVNLCTSHDQHQRVLGYLKDGLTRRPVAVEWHRQYQALREPRAPTQLKAQYDKFLEQEPKNSALHYLRGRLASRNREARRHYQKAIELDTKNPYPQNAMAYGLAGQGEWEKAREYSARACKLAPKSDWFEGLLLHIRFAARDFKALESELRADLKRNPTDWRKANNLALVLAMDERPDEARQVHTTYRKAYLQQYKEDKVGALPIMAMNILYAIGDFEKLEKKAKAEENFGNHFMALIEQGKPQDAVKLLPLEKADSVDPFLYLLTALALRHAGQEEVAAGWHARGKTLLSKQGDEYRAFVSLLDSGQAVSVAELKEYVIDFQEKAILATLLAEQRGPHSSEIARFGLRLNIYPEYPYHLLKRVLKNLAGSRK